MPTTLGVVGEESVLLALVRGLCSSSESSDLVFLPTVDLTDPGSIAARGPTVAGSPAELVASSGVILVATKPERTAGALGSLAPFVGEDHVVVVSSAKTSLEDLRPMLGAGPALLRLALGPGGLAEGLLVLSAEEGTATEMVERAAETLGRLGIVEVVPEEYLELACAVAAASRHCLSTALAGIADGAMTAGLPRDLAGAFTRQTAMTTAVLLKEHPGSPADLKDQVASPGGITLAGLGVLEDLGVRGAFMRAIEAATLQADEARDAEQSHVVE